MTRMTVAEAKAAGLLDSPKKKRTTRKALPRDGAKSRCHACGEIFTTTAAEERHTLDARHYRFETVIETETET
jgi:hypothetical protein